MRAALHRPTGEPFYPADGNREAVETALHGLPSHGWTAGMFGRRDRALLVLSQLAGVPYKHLATLISGDIRKKKVSRRSGQRRGSGRSPRMVTSSCVGRARSCGG